MIEKLEDAEVDFSSETKLTDLVSILIRLTTIHYKEDARRLGAPEMARRLLASCDVTERSLLLDANALREHLEVNKRQHEILTILLELAK